MTERKSRFGDRSVLPEDPALQVLQLRPRGVANDPAAPVTYPGRLAAEDQQALVVRLQKARDEANGSKAQLDTERAERQRERAEGLLLLSVDPESIGLTAFANRSELSLSIKDEKFKAFKESIRRNGQDTPVRVRPAAAGAATTYELVEGHRRHAAIRELNREVEGGFPILARLDAKAADAKDLVLKMYRENAEREDLSAFEIGGMFAQWLHNGLYKSQRDISAATHMHETTVGQYVAIAELPAEIIAAFRDPRTIAVRWSKDLAKACRDRLKVVIARATKLAKVEPAPDAEAVYR